MPPTPQSEYERLKSKTILEVCMERAQLDGAVSSSRRCQLVYEEKMLEQQFEYQKQQIELQHEKDMVLLKTQLAKQEDMIATQTKAQSKWMIVSVIITAVATLSAAIAGALVQHMLHMSEPKIKPQTDIQQNIQRQSGSSPVGLPSATISKLPEKEEAKQKLKK